MANQISKLKDPEDGNKTVMYVIGGLAVAALAYWYFTREAKAEPKAIVEEETPPVEDEPGAEELLISADCMTVKVGAKWSAEWLQPRIIQAVYSDMGGPILSNDPEVLNASMNAVARDMLQPWTTCGAKVPWPDWYVASNPVPVPEEGQARAQFFQLMENHRDAFADQLGASFTQYPQLNELIGEIGRLVEQVYLDRYGYDQEVLIQGGTDLGGSQGKLSTVQKTRLRAMGYEITDEVIELFQSDFNSVMMTWVGGEWFIDMFLEPTNEMDNATDDSIEFAWRASANRGVAWLGMVSQATGFGANNEPPKEAPTA
jgi:hypothetical protein